MYYSMNPHICQILKLCILKNTLKPVSNKKIQNIDESSNAHMVQVTQISYFILYKKDIFQKIMVAEENWEVWKKF